MAELTALWVKAVGGDRQAQDDFFRQAEPELRKLALHWIARKSAKGRVRTTEVIDRAYMKLMKLVSKDWPHRGRFYAFACRNIMCVLIDLLKPTRPSPEPSVETAAPERGLTAHSLMTLHQALKDLEQDLSETHRAIVELRFLGECTLDEIAEMLSMSRDRVFRDSKVALLYLRKKLHSSSPDLLEAR